MKRVQPDDHSFACAPEQGDENLARTAEGKVQVLDRQWIEAFAELQKLKIISLPQEQKYFLKPRSLADLENGIRNGLLLGMVLDGELIGGALVAYPGNHTGDLKSYPLDKDCAVVQSVMTHPAFAKRGVGQKILSEAETIVSQKFSAMIAKIAVNNHVSQQTFRKAGYKLIIDNYLD
ncbi:MAG: GNAT family N-acetyltransferase, partial [Pseudomonadota bacterium]